MELGNAAQANALFIAQGNKRWAISASTARERRRKLKLLRDAVVARKEELFSAIQADFGKPRAETYVTELIPFITEIDHTIHSLARWMKPRRLSGTLMMPLCTQRLVYEAKGRVLIMAPWNYPFLLLMSPVVSAVAAGNVVMAKPSAKAKATSSFIADLIASVFPPDEVAVIECSGAQADVLLALPFDHVFFTGSPEVGAQVAAKASASWADITLELGGKSPAVILENVDIRDTARKLAWAKNINAGQTCVAPDYAFVPEKLADEFAAAYSAAVASLYGATEEDRGKTAHFARMIDGKAFARVKGLVEKSVAAGAKAVIGGRFDESGRYIAPTLLSGVTADMPIMGEEIFGPILPLMTYRDLDDAIDFIRGRDKPLALYVYGKRAREADKVIALTSSGGALSNNSIVHLANPNMPFGGTGKSGMGRYHGRFGFETFSHQRAYMKQGPINTAAFLSPPYEGKFQSFIFKAIETFLRLR